MSYGFSRTLFIALLCVSCLSAAPASSTEGGADFVHYQLGLKYKNDKQLDLAVEEFRKVLAAYPDNYNAYMQLAEIQEFQGQHRLAIFNLKKALAYNPGWGRAVKTLAAVYEKDGQTQSAVKELQDYQLSCDPAERDSLQSQIDRLIGRIRTAAPVQASASSNAPVKQMPSVEEIKPVPRKAGGISPKVRSEKADEAFGKAVEAYSTGLKEPARANELFDEALGYLKTVLKAAPDYYGAYYYAGLIRRRNGQNDMAEYNFKKAVNYPDLGHNSYFYLGKIYGEQKKYGDAVANLRKYIELTTYEQGRTEAKSLLTKYEGLYKAANPVIPKVDVKALASKTAGDELYHEVSQVPPEAVYSPLEVRIDSMLTMAIVDTLTDPGQAMLSGVRAFMAGRYDDAMLEFKKILVKYPNGDVAARCMYDQGVCLMKLGKWGQAEQKFSQVLSAHKNSEIAPAALFLRAVALDEKGERAQAEKTYREYLQNNPKHAWTARAWEKLGDLSVDQMQYKRAAEAFDKASTAPSATAQDRVISYVKCGDAFLKIDNPARALAAWEAAAATGEKSGVFVKVPDAQFRIADYYYRVKQFDKALEKYQKVTRTYPSFQDTPWGLFQIGSIYRAQKKYDQAITTFKNLIAKYPDDYWARQAKWKLDDTVWEYEYRSVLR